MDDEAIRGYVEQHSALLNQGIHTRDFGKFLDTFADDAVMRFEGRIGVGRVNPQFARSNLMTTDLDAGVLLTSAVESSGTSTFASGK